ncbi:uncharacterized protein LOC110739088 [Chenopodium quinoa]|uniref:uncharacterized protein LOC110739088 n=1 Tax=Chenopodium quinoa TaxID=63459 RepID=UPI000B78678F|nr:uncharacterized protein LOC110739088 [Chenopodium quinoa]
MENNYFVSPNLIEQVQILLKKEAGFESFDFNDHSIESPQPSSILEEAIVGSNPSVDALRCKNCSGELLRGSESIICIYCGNTQLQDILRHPICFNNTVAFQWFLKSLDLDGFEKVGVLLGDHESGNRGRSSFKEEEIWLSDYLDLQLKGLDDSRELGVRNEERLPGKRFLSLVGVDIEQILAQDCIDHGFSVGSEQMVTSQKIGNENCGISGDRSLSLFENTQSTEAVSRSDEGENGESFSDWGAEFQSAFPESGHEKSASSSIADAFSGSNLTTSGKNLWSNSESGPPFNPNVSEGNFLVEGGGKAIESVDASFDWLPADQRPNVKNDSPNIDEGDGDESFDDWGDFRMSTSDNVSTTVPGIGSSGGMVTFDPFNDFTDFTIFKDIKHPNNSLTEPDKATPSTGGQTHLQINNNKTKQYVGTGDLALLDGTHSEYQGVNVDRNQNKISDQGHSTGLWSNDIHLGINNELGQLQGGESKLPTSGTASEVGNSFDSWSDFAGLGVENKEEQAVSFKVVDAKGNGHQNDSLTLLNDKSLDAWGYLAGSGGFPDSKPATNDNISSGVWNDFSGMISSHANQPQSSNTRTTENQAVFTDDNLFGSWSDFRSSGIPTGNSSLGPIDTKSSSDQTDFQKASNSLKMVDDNSTLSSWGDFGGATSVLEQQLQVAGAGSSGNKLSSEDGDLFSRFSDSGKQYTIQPDNRHHCDKFTIHDGESICEDEDSFGAWTDFTSLSNLQGNLPSSANAPDDKEAVEHGDPFDTWNVIVSSPSTQVGKDTAVATFKTPESNLLSLDTNSNYVGPNNSMPLDLNAGLFSHQNGSAPVASSPSEGPDLDRTEHGDVKADVNGMNPSESTFKEALDLKSPVAETLISEMHDLSFMLESSLSIPNTDR